MYNFLEIYFFFRPTILFYIDAVKVIFLCAGVKAENKSFTPQLHDIFEKMAMQRNDSNLTY